jgi:aspartyl-tRNA synthetase
MSDTTADQQAAAPAPATETAAPATATAPAPATESTPVVADNKNNGGNKKNKKKKEKKPKKQKGKSQQQAERKAPLVDHPDNHVFGDLVRNQSQYKTDRKWTDIIDLHKDLAGQSVWLRARVHNVRGKGKSCFLVLRRGFATVQAVLFASDEIPRELVKFAQKVPSESIVEVQANVVETPNPTKTTQSDIELSITKMFVVSVSDVLPFPMEDAMAPLPADADEDAKLEKDWERGAVGRKIRLDNRQLDLRTPANHAIFRIQSKVCQFFRQYFYDKGFIEVHTPKITPGVSEGGSEVFRTDYFGRPACLAQSPQLYKQMSSVASDLFKVFEIGPVFRAENSNTHRHMCEFTGLDFEMEIREHYHECLDVLGNLFLYIFDRLNEECKAEMQIISQQYPFEPLKYKSPTVVIPFSEAIQMLRDAGVEAGDYEDLSTPQEKMIGKLVREKYDTDFYIIDLYPMAARPFYTMPSPENDKYTNSYDVFLRGEEITSGAQRIHEVEMLAKRATECDIPLDNISSYLESFKYGTPPHAGAGIGMERVVMLFLGLDDIRKACLFPRDPMRLEP